MASVTFDIVRKVCEDQGLDCITVYNGSKSSGVIDKVDRSAQGVLDVVDRMRNSAQGTLLFVARKGETKGAIYEWTVQGTNGAAAVGSLGASGSAWLQPYVDTKLELETLKIRQQYEGREDGIGKMADTLLQYLPVVAKSVGIDIPMPVAKAKPRTDAQDDDDDDGDGGDTVGTKPGALTKDELEDVLADVVELAKRNPAAVRDYAGTLKTMADNG